MKRIYKIFIIFILIIGAFIVGCSNGAVDKGGDNNDGDKVFYSLNYIAGQGGQIIGYAKQRVDIGDDGKSVTAVPNDGYKFVKWSDDRSEPERREINVSANKTVTALFEKIRLEVNYIASKGGQVVGENIQTVDYGNSGETVVAVADDGYRFVKWSDECMTAERREENVIGDLSVVAEFECIFGGGSGTKSDPFLISTYEQLCHIDLCPDACYVLTTDLDLKAEDHYPLFDSEKDPIYGSETLEANSGFDGIFDGKGHTVNNMKINTYKGNYPSFFGIIGCKGIVKNLNIKNAEINLSNYFQAKYLFCNGGILAGYSAGLISNVNVDGKFDGEVKSSYAHIGGMVGKTNGEIVACSTRVEFDLFHSVIDTTGEFPDDRFDPNKRYTSLIGGIVGFCDSALLRGNDVVCIIDSELSYPEIGGLMGGYRNSAAAVKSTVADCNSRLTVKCTSNMRTAGFAVEIMGAHKNVSVTNCVAECDYTMSNVKESIGFVWDGRDVTFERCAVTGKLKTVGQSNMAIGFGRVLKGSSVVRCRVNVDMRAKYAVGFIWYCNECVVDRCSAIGEMKTNTAGSGFIDVVKGSRVSNCFTNMQIEILGGMSGRIIVGGMFGSIDDSYVSNCYYGGKIFGVEYNDSDLITSDSVAAFAFTFNSGTIENCHCLMDSDYVKKSIYNLRCDDVDLIIYDSARSMYGIADQLNANSKYPIWENVENDFPRLIDNT